MRNTSDGPGPRPLPGDIDEAVHTAARSQTQSIGASSPDAAPRWRAWLTVLCAPVLLGSLWLAWQGIRDPHPIDPDVLAAQTLTTLDLARQSVDDYRGREGRLPSDLAEAGLAGLPIEYTLVDGGYEVSAPDPWGGTFGYHGDTGPSR